MRVEHKCKIDRLNEIIHRADLGLHYGVLCLTETRSYFDIPADLDEVVVAVSTEESEDSLEMELTEYSAEVYIPETKRVYDVYCDLDEMIHEVAMDGSVYLTLKGCKRVAS